jgi:hypothetical protein
LQNFAFNTGGTPVQVQTLAGGDKFFFVFNSCNSTDESLSLSELDSLNSSSKLRPVAVLVLSNPAVSSDAGWFLLLLLPVLLVFLFSFFRFELVFDVAGG